ncbi:TspO/MBR related protein [Palleronia aestuarii]|uniref:TspO/MBR related protein n=1 Tax=Palleronia aestuarii TaxID=568105 RepID=A0A2W7NUT6_9RHOB|nr:TspO/MBR family protein [Palleronia aestuarii]PZX17116.1 TspO/MBR related protein [Palleronia aestuarii]
MDWTLFLIFLFSCGAAAATGAAFKPGRWYEALEKPSWTPPNWVFPVAWTLLYLFMSFAAARVAVEPLNAYAMAFFAMQIAFNTLWTPVFFGLHNTRGGLVVIAFLWFAVAGTLFTFLERDLLAGLLIVPYLAWVTIAAALNFEVWRLNRHAPMAT